VDPVPDPLLFFFGTAGNRTRAFGSVAKNSDHRGGHTHTINFTYLRICRKDWRTCNFIPPYAILVWCLLVKSQGQLYVYVSEGVTSFKCKFQRFSPMKQNANKNRQLAGTGSTVLQPKCQVQQARPTFPGATACNGVWTHN
jgi:hypothetical protein